MNSSKCCPWKSRWAANGMQIPPRKSLWTALLLTLRADGRWALFTPHCLHRVHFCPGTSRKAVFSAWITPVPGGQENSWTYLLASQTANKGKIHLHPHHFLLNSSSFQPSIYLHKSQWNWSLCTHGTEEFAFMLSHGTWCCFCYLNNKTLSRCPFINLLSFYNGK